ncbi:MAG: RIP metalloprotease RseP [Bacteroidia bacterium]|nr:RIP metalloprotease RseP [Bacteroidia bacterium]
MSRPINNNLKSLGILAGIILAIFVIGYITGYLNEVSLVFKSILLILISITILVTVHELGHFMAAKAFGIKVEIFSIGFPPKLFGFKRGETDYQIGAIPLGGYVKIAGMIDESMDREVIERERQREKAEKGNMPVNKAQGPQTWEYRAKPIWQRFIVMSAGVIMNVILGVFLFSALKYTVGEKRTPMTEIVGGITVTDSPASLGSILNFKTGDEIVSYKGKTFEYVEDYQRQDLLIAEDAWYEVKREGEIVRINVPPTIQNHLGDKNVKQWLFLYEPTTHITVNEDRQIIGDIEIQPVGYMAGLRSGDRIVKMDDTPVFWFNELSTFLDGKANQSINITHVRGKDTLISAVQLDSIGKLSVIPYFEEIEYDLWTAISIGSKEAFRLVRSNAQGFYNITKEGVDAGKSVMGLPRIANLLRKVWDDSGIPGFLWVTGALSMILAFINILPIPVFDGGHIVFLLIEAITRREPSVKVRLIAQQIGLLLILTLMILVLANDFIQSPNW